MSKIEWTDKMINPIVGCSQISPGCVNCYAIGLAHRFQSLAKFSGLTNSKYQWSGKINFDLSALSKIPKKPCRIFIGSMTDLFYKPDKLTLQIIFSEFTKYPNHSFQILTKRPKQMLETNFSGDVSNVWMGVSCENQKCLDDRLPLLMKSPFPVKFLSVEPMLESLTLKHHDQLPDWVIIGGESGKARSTRSFCLEWAIKLIKECDELNIPVFFKQAGSRPIFRNKLLTLNNSKGSDLSELPEILNRREFPSN